jgi:transcriptional regulator with XRE-family HTH domain
MERGLTQKELAVMVSGGLDYTYIGKIERGEQLPSLKILLKISEALSVPMAWFFQDQTAAGHTYTEWSCLTGTEAGRRLVKDLKSLEAVELPLVAEIVHVLVKHRKENAEQKSSDWPIAAENPARYKKDPKKRER